MCRACRACFGVGELECSPQTTSLPIRTPLNATLTRAPPTTHTEGDENAHARWRCGVRGYEFTPPDAAHLVDCKAVSREWGARQVQMDDGGLSVGRNIG